MTKGFTHINYTSIQNSKNNKTDDKTTFTQIQWQ